MKFAIGKASIATLCLTIAILTPPAYSVTNELVASSESHSIEKFDSGGNWIRTFASTGPWISLGIASSPVTGDVFVATITSTILRYNKSGFPFGPKGIYWSTFSLASLVGGNPIEGLLFDSSGNLYVSTYYGTSGYQVEIFRFSAGQLLKPAPLPSGPPIVTTTGRGNQMAWDVFGNICIASFIAPNTVQCYNPTTAVLTHDYASEIQAASIQPVGLRFGPNNNLTVNSVFNGQVWVEAVEQVGPMNLLASGMTADVGFLAVGSDGMLYMPSFHNPEGRYEGSNFCSFYACMDYDFSSDVVYKIDPNNGTVTKFITTHIWGPYQLIFVPF
jgi:DNA-binding beta-propeller fold protein YncE